MLDGIAVMLVTAKLIIKNNYVHIMTVVRL